MDKDKAIEEFTEQPWGNVICTVVLIGIGEIIGIGIGWMIFA